MTYDEWIAKYAERNEMLLGMCKSASADMVLAFPELKVETGTAYTDWGPREHFWCVTADGTIVDPTKAQFPFGHVFEYVAYDLSMEVKVGRCRGCGDDILARLDAKGRPVKEDFYSNEICSEKCDAEYAAYMHG